MTIKKEEVVAKGIVLTSKPYKESDALVTVYFKEYGKMTLIARGVKKIKSKNASALMPLTYSEITFIPRVGLSTLVKASSQCFYRYIKEDLFLEAYASYFVEFIIRNESDNLPDANIFNYLKQSLDLLEQGYVPQLIYLLYNVFVLKQIGSPLMVDACSQCGRTDHIAGISFQGGGFVCSHCLSPYDYRLNKDQLKQFRHLHKIDIQHIDNLKIDEAYYPDFIKIMDRFIDEYSGIVFRSRKFIRQMSKL